VRQINTEDMCLALKSRSQKNYEAPGVGKVTYTTKVIRPIGREWSWQSNKIPHNWMKGVGCSKQGDKKVTSL
jgi:hypothetical protein